MKADLLIVDELINHLIDDDDAIEPGHAIIIGALGKNEKPQPGQEARRRRPAQRNFVRIGKQTVEAWGDLRNMHLRVRGSPKLILNDKQTPAKVENGLLTYDGN